MHRGNNYGQQLEDTTVGIFERLWTCGFSRNLTTSEEHYKYFGRPSTGIKALDKQFVDDVVITAITINDMVEMHRKGITVEVVNYDDTRKIYECIQKHLMAWRDWLKSAVNMVTEPPIEDLVDLDRFANAIYAHAKYLIPKDQIDSVFITQMQSRLTFSRGSIQSIFERREEANKPVEEVYPDRQELGDDFKRAVTGFGRWK